MQLQQKMRFIVASVAFFAAVIPACEDPNQFQPITDGAKPWTPPACFHGAPNQNCAVGYYVAIDSCPDCTGVSYALCTGYTFDQCVCGQPYTPGAQCPLQIHCGENEFPPQNWLDYGTAGGQESCGWYIIDKPTAAPDGGT